MDGSNRKSLMRALRELRLVLAFYIPFVIVGSLFAAMLGMVALVLFQRFL